MSAPHAKSSEGHGVIQFPRRPRRDVPTTKKLALLNHIAVDANVSAAAFKLAYHLVNKFFYRTTGEARVDQETLAKVMGTSSRHIRRLLGELDPYFTTIKPHRPHPGGRAIPNRYKPIFAIKAETDSNIITPAPPAYAFEGRIIKVVERDLEQWRKTYSAIPDICAALQACDDYLSLEENPGKWFFRASNWLKRENERHVGRQADPHSW